MEIKKVHYWSKVIQQETVNHVELHYSEDGQEIKSHQFGKYALASPEFYKAMEDFNEFVAKSCSLPEELVSAISVREITITTSEDKEGNDNSKYKIVSGFKSGHASTTITVDVQHKYIPEGFEDALNDIISEAEEYVSGKRGQIEMDLEESEGQTENDLEDEDVTNEELLEEDGE